MIVLPIGTKASLALKPKLTIALIAANVAFALFTIPLMMRSEKELFRVQRERYALQLRMYLSERPSDVLPKGIPERLAGELANGIESAEDPRSLELALYQAFSLSGIDPEEFQRYGESLEESSRPSAAGIASEAMERAAYGAADGGTGLLARWRELGDAERRTLEGSVLGRFGLVPSRMSRAHTFLTYLFLHEGLLHLLGNMLFLWVVGCLLEDTWGRIPFLLFYLAGGVIAGLIHCAANTDSTLPLVGASGAIAAAMGAFAIRHFWTRIKFFYLFFLFIKPYAGTFHLPAFVFLPFWFLQQIALHYLNGFLGQSSNVAYMAHIGGFSAGVIGALVMRLSGFEKRVLAPSVQKTQVKAGVLKDPRFDRACELLERGALDSARALFDKLLSDRPEDIDLLRDVAMLYREKDLLADYGSLMDRSLKLLVLRGNMDEASRLALDVLREDKGISLSSQYLLRAAKHLAEIESYGDSYDLYRWIIASHPSSTASLRAALDLARILADKMNNTRSALALIEEARKQPHGPEWEAAFAEIEGLINSRVNTLSA